MIHLFFFQWVRVLHDQWFTPRRIQHNQPLSNGSSPPPASAQFSDSPSVPGPEDGVRGRRKLSKALLKRINTTERSVFIADKGGVRVSSELQIEDGMIQLFVEKTEICELKLFVENTGQKAVYFTYFTALHWLQYFTLEDSKKVTRNNPLCLEPSERYEVTLRFKAKQTGVYPATLAFEFKENTQPGTSPFHIVRFIQAEYRSELAALLGPEAPYKPKRLEIFEPARCNIDEGVPPESLARNLLLFVLPLDNYTRPSYISDLAEVLKGSRSFPKLQEQKSILESDLGFHNYMDRFDLLLYLEEDQMRVDIKRYNKDDVSMVRDHENKRLLVLELPGVSENRPSVLRGDHLLLTKSEEVKLSAVTKYKGYVHRVELDQVKLGFSKRLLDGFIDNMKFRVEFTVNRLPLKLQHRAVHMAIEHDLEDVLFPVASRSVTPAPTPALRLFDQKLDRNPEQKTAVCNIVAGTSKPAPYLVFGPPGTGKTVTIVEAIKQVEKNTPGAYILACAPSNSAADQLCEMLITSQHVDSRKIYRVYASSRNPKDIPKVLEKNSNVEGGTIIFPCKEDLMYYKILVSTLVTAGRLVSGGFPVGHFSHIFVDEAGHAVEPETIISVAGLLDAKTGQLVLAGDPKQLGPILRSPFAIKYGLGLSLLERLMTQNELYQKGTSGFDNRYVTKLLQNYRSHPSILKIPNEMFYDGELLACADMIISSQYCMWDHLPKKGFPVIFHGVVGKDERESNSPSFFNTSEIDIMMDYLKKLLLTQAKKGIAKISPKEIGIIAPYRKQVEKIRKAIKMHSELKSCLGIEELKVGSVEEFQGQERKVIIVSTVRSDKQYTVLDETFNIGFLKNEKRFNVAVTRAKSLLIMVGNPIILQTDPTWGSFIKYCIDQGGYTGYDLSNLEDTEAVVERLLALNICEEIIAAVRAIGLDFIEMLEETNRRSITDRNILKDIYNEEFRDRSFFIADKHGVRVSSELYTEFGKIHMCVDQAEVYELKLFVENTGQDAVYFTYYTALHWLHCFTLEDSRKVTRSNPLRLEPCEKYEVTVRFKSSHVGVYLATLAFEFKQNTEPTTRPFHIVRFIEVEYRTKLAALLGPTEPFRPLRLNILEPENCKVDEGIPPEGTLLQSPLGFHNYAERFDLLLYLEECQMHVDIKRYNKDQVTLVKDHDKRLMVLNLPGVSENRPSVLRGDHLLLTKSEDVQLSTVTKYKGYVHKVELDRVKLGFSRRFLEHVHVDKMKFRVEFTVNRLPLRLQHRAVHMAVQHKLRDVLFPMGSRDVTPSSPPALRLFNQQLERNPEQYSAVCHIVAGTSKPAPYLVFGPPGTGKTVTIVEAIKQNISNLEGEMIVFPCKEDLMSYKILVSTLVTAGRLVSGGFPVDHFSHIFVDEAGHAIESETIISVAEWINNGAIIISFTATNKLKFKMSEAQAQKTQSS
ncbi:helicase mov-10 [Labeo rohita]|uniref:RNA helicase n=1 Tax=Labeo rohita TaxID=84645 RepID=A0A498NYW1_LABRO|nr:helicase mov-10 [Labeo rohita]